MRNIIVTLMVMAVAVSTFAASGITISGNEISYSNSIDDSSWGPGDMFGIADRSENLPFAVADDSAGSFTPDTQGIIKTNDMDKFFGAVDTYNGDNPNGVGTAVWEFDVAGLSNITVSIDMAAMGDFESSNDSYLFEVAFDGGTYTTLFASSIDEDGSADYTMESGTAVSLSDPMYMDGTLLSNDFQTLTEAVIGSGSVLSLKLTGGSDGGSEAFAFRNIAVTPEPTSMILLGLGGVLFARRK